MSLFRTVINSMIEYEEEDSEVTQILVHSTKAEEEIKETEENEIYRESKPDMFDDDDEKERTKNLSLHNPFDEIQETIDIKDKVVHLSTINTNENLVQDDINEEQSEEGANDLHQFDQNNINEQFIPLDQSGSVVKVISKKDENEDSQKTENNSEVKQNLFSGPDSLLREIMLRTPRSSKDQAQNVDRTDPDHFHNMNEAKAEDNSDAATKKRIDVSNLQGTITPNSSASSQFFQNNSSFQKFSILQFNNMIESKDFGVLLQLREKAIKYREKAERRIIEKMIESQKYSPRMLNDKKSQLEKWVSKEKEEIKQTKNHLLEKWNQTKAVLEQTEHNAKMIKQQLGSVGCSRKASLNFASPLSEQALDSINLLSYNEGSKTEKNVSVDEDEETKVRQYSEPHRLLQSESENLGGHGSNSAISLRISVLSNKSEELDLKKNSMEFYKLQRTREVEKLASLIPPELVEERKNHSETFIVGDIFKTLLYEDDDMDKLLLQKPKAMDLPDNKIFEYKPQPETPQEKSSQEEDEEIDKSTDKFDLPAIKSLEKSPSDLLDDFEDNGEIQPRIKHSPETSDDALNILDAKLGHHRKESSKNSSDIKKVDDLDMERLLGDDEPVNLEEGFFGQISDQFSGKLDQNFLREFNNEIKMKSLSAEDINEENAEHVVAVHEKSNERWDTPESEHSNFKFEHNTTSSKEEEEEEKTEEKSSTKPEINLPKMLDDASTLMSKSQPAQIVDGFSPQNLAAKLLNSLNNKSEKQENTNEMLIFDNDQPKPIENLEPKTLEKLEPEEEQKDSGIESGVETLSIVPFVEIHSKKQNEFNQKENIVDLLLSQLVNEIKENMFPARPTLDSFLDANDPTSCYAPMGKSPFSWFSIQSDLISKLAFENDKGISTGFNSCDFYLKDVIDEIMKNESTFINNILTPIQRDPMEMMRLLQTSDIGNYSHFDTYDPIIPILGVEIYLEIERRKEMDRQENGETSDRSNSESLITEWEHIHNKAIFDCINESLNQFRPYGKEGVPMMWSTKLRKLREDEILEFSKMFEIIKQDLFRWWYTGAGTLPKREFVNDTNNFDEEYFNEIREKRLATLLAADVMDTEYKWVNYDFEESQVKLDLWDMILEQLFSETVDVLNQIREA